MKMKSITVLLSVIAILLASFVVYRISTIGDDKPENNNKAINPLPDLKESGNAEDVSDTRDIKGGTSEQAEKANPENVMFELLVSNKELDRSYAASFNDNFNKVAFGRLQKLKKRFASTKTQKIEATKRIGDFSLSIISFDNKKENAAHTTQLFLVRQDDGWKYFHEDNFKKDNLVDNPFNDKQLKDIKSLFQWGEENGL